MGLEPVETAIGVRVEHRHTTVVSTGEPIGGPAHGRRPGNFVRGAVRVGAGEGHGRRLDRLLVEGRFHLIRASARHRGETEMVPQGLFTYEPVQLPKGLVNNPSVTQRTTGDETRARHESVRVRQATGGPRPVRVGLWSSEQLQGDLH